MLEYAVDRCRSGARKQQKAMDSKQSETFGPPAELRQLLCESFRSARFQDRHARRTLLGTSFGAIAARDQESQPSLYRPKPRM